MISWYPISKHTVLYMKHYMLGKTTFKIKHTKELLLHLIFLFTNRSPSRFYTRPTLCNNYICDIFLLIEKSTVNSYADDTTHFSNGTSVVLNHMENETSNVFDWFSKNFLKVNPDKSNLLLTSTGKNSMKIEFCI